MSDQTRVRPPTPTPSGSEDRSRGRRSRWPRWSSLSRPTQDEPGFDKLNQRTRWSSLSRPLVRPFRRLWTASEPYRSAVRPLLDAVARILAAVTGFGWAVLALAGASWLLAVLFGWGEFALLAAVLLIGFLIACGFTLGRLNLAVELEADPLRVTVGESSAARVSVTNLARTLDHLKQRGIWLTGTSDRAGQSLYQANLTGPAALVLGAEGKGIRRLTEERCDFLVSIPMAGQVSSLNVSVATGVCLFEAVRQRRKA